MDLVVVAVVVVVGLRRLCRVDVGLDAARRQVWTGSDGGISFGVLECKT